MALFTIANATINLNIPADLRDRIDVYLSTSTGNQAKILQEIQSIMLDLTKLTNEVAENQSAIGSAVTLLGTLSQQIRDLSADPAALNALADQLDANSNALAAAVAANTPASPTA